jgi:hypothetical protein
MRSLGESIGAEWAQNNAGLMRERWIAATGGRRTAVQMKSSPESKGKDRGRSLVWDSCVEMMNQSRSRLHLAVESALLACQPGGYGTRFAVNET